MRMANSVEKMQVFCAWSSLRISACTVPRTLDSGFRFDLVVFGLIETLDADQAVAGDAEQGQAEAVVVAWAIRRDTAGGFCP